MKKGYIYKLTHNEQYDYTVYIGQTINPKDREYSHLNGYSTTHNWKIRKFVSKYGAQSFKFEIIWEGDYNLLNDMEIKLIEEYKNIYGNNSLFNITSGGEGVDSDTAYKNNMIRIKNGTHPFLTEEFKNKTRFRNKEKVKNGTFNLNSELATRLNNERVKNGTHIWLNNKISTEKMQKRINSGIPYIIGCNGEYSTIYWSNHEIKNAGFNLAHVISVCKGRLKSHKNNIFKYHPEYIPKR